mmetsp:Transcript_21938/g.30837  ORF Transcript_21938/g.30837 Transcript_21938/m.30837 type:complete len:86 (-) Transcript_21938:470-727(-)
MSSITEHNITIISTTTREHNNFEWNKYPLLSLYSILHNNKEVMSALLEIMNYKRDSDGSLNDMIQKIVSKSTTLQIQTLNIYTFK